MTMKDNKTVPAPERTPLIKIRLVRSLIGYPPVQRATAKGLGLRKIGSEVVRPDTLEVRGMINKISHLVKVNASEEQ